MLGGCVNSGRLTTPSGKPEVRISRSWAKRLPVAIASYNMANGRHLDEARRDAVVTYDGVQTPDGKLEVRSKTIYNIIDDGDSVRLTSTRLMTDDLDDDDASVALDQPSLEEQQQDLMRIIVRLSDDVAADTESVHSSRADGDRSR
jgi:hypothetical protein